LETLNFIAISGFRVPEDTETVVPVTLANEACITIWILSAIATFPRSSWVGAACGKAIELRGSGRGRFQACIHRVQSELEVTTPTFRSPNTNFEDDRTSLRVAECSRALVLIIQQVVGIIGIIVLGAKLARGCFVTIPVPRTSKLRVDGQEAGVGSASLNYRPCRTFLGFILVEERQ
jgi:hypothetical protein